MTTKKQEEKNSIEDKIAHKPEEPLKLKGKYISAIGKRKAAAARIRLYKKGNGLLAVNERRINEYFTPQLITIIKQFTFLKFR